MRVGGVYTPVAPRTPEATILELLRCACDFARLTRRQTAAVMLYASGAVETEIADTLGIPRDCVRETLLGAERKLRRAHPAVQSVQSREANEILACIRNVRRTGNVPVIVFDRWNRRPAYPRVRPMSSEDLVQDFGSFLLALMRQLAVRAAAV